MGRSLVRRGWRSHAWSRIPQHPIGIEIAGQLWRPPGLQAPQRGGRVRGSDWPGRRGQGSAILRTRRAHLCRSRTIRRQRLRRARRSDVNRPFAASDKMRWFSEGLSGVLLLRCDWDGGNLTLMSAPTVRPLASGRPATVIHLERRRLETARRLPGLRVGPLKLRLHQTLMSALRT